jgi:transposase
MKTWIIRPENNSGNDKSKPILQSLKTWLLENTAESNSKVLPKSKIGQSHQLALGMWHRIERYIEDGKYEIDNNWVETPSGQ